ncbi:MAG: hypothetical protein ACR2OH_02725 [Microthrixaceae bacterium]
MSHPSSSATSVLWDRRDRRVPAVAAAAALTGVSATLLRDAAKVSFTASVECEAILSSMTERERSLPMQLDSVLERCVHEVRGPVIWSETMTARANAFGDEDVFVCATVRKGYDAPQNQLLVWILSEAAHSFKAVRGPLGEFMVAGDRRRVEEMAINARKWRQSSRLSSVAPRRPGTREMQRMRTGRHGEQVEPLLTARRRLLQPFSAQDIEDLTDERTTILHTGVLEVFDAVSEAVGLEMVVEFDSGAMRVGPVAFRHPESLGTAPAGLSVSGQRVDDLDQAIHLARRANQH